MYSPKIKDNLIKRLYELNESKQEKKPMTYYVNDAIEQYLIKEEKKLPKRNFR